VSRRRVNHYNSSVWDSVDTVYTWWIVTHLDAAAGMLLGTQKEGAIDQWIAIEYEQRLLAQNAGHPAHLGLGQRGEDEEARLIVAVVALVLNLKDIGKWKSKCISRLDSMKRTKRTIPNLNVAQLQKY